MAFTQRNMAAGKKSGPGDPPKKKYDPVTNPQPRNQDVYKKSVDVLQGEKLSKDPKMRALQIEATKKTAAEYKNKTGENPTGRNITDIYGATRFDKRPPKKK